MTDPHDHAAERLGAKLDDVRPTSPFGEYLREMRTAAGKSLREVAEELAISHVYLGEVERGRRRVLPAKYWKKLAQCVPGISRASLKQYAAASEPIDPAQMEGASRPPTVPPPPDEFGAALGRVEATYYRACTTPIGDDDSADQWRAARARLRALYDAAQRRAEAAEGDKEAMRSLWDDALCERNACQMELAALKAAMAVPDEGAVGSPERDLRVIASRIQADLATGRYMSGWCVRRLVEIADLFAALSAERGQAVEGVVREGQVRGSMWTMEPVVSVQPTDWPIGTRVRVTALPKEAE